MGLALVQQSLQQSLQTNAEALSRIESGIKELKGEIKEVENKMDTNSKEIVDLKLYIVGGLAGVIAGEKFIELLIKFLTKA
jgi:peptidoglycan hydrolase CwlO-like protein